MFRRFGVRSMLRALLIVSAAASSIGCYGRAYGVITGHPDVRLPCKYGDECKDEGSTQFTSGVWRQLPDSTAGLRLVRLWVDHLQEPWSRPELGLASTVEFESFDSTVALDVSSVRILHRARDGTIIRPERVQVDTLPGCANCGGFYKVVRVTQVYGYRRIDRRLTEEVSAVLLVRGARVPVHVVFRDVRYRLWWTVWDVWMGV